MEAMRHGSNARSLVLKTGIRLHFAQKGPGIGKPEDNPNIWNL